MGELLELAIRITPQWLAGFFDGDGSVGVSNRGGRNRCPGVTVQMSQKDPTSLVLISLKYPEFILQGPHKNGVHYIQASGRECVEFLELIKDYVICKKKQVEYGIEMAKLTNTPLAHNRRLSDEVIEVRKKIGNEIQRLNNTL